MTNYAVFGLLVAAIALVALGREVRRDRRR